MKIFKKIFKKNREEIMHERTQRYGSFIQNMFSIMNIKKNISFEKSEQDNFQIIISSKEFIQNMIALKIHRYFYCKSCYDYDGYTDSYYDLLNYIDLFEKEFSIKILYKDKPIKESIENDTKNK